jgi:hypothetical protein
VAIRIQFDVSKTSWDQECLALPIDVGGRIVRVLITPEALTRRFGAVSTRRDDLERSIIFTADRLALQSLARSFVASGRVSPTGEVRIEKDDVMAVSFSEKILRSRETEITVRQATRQLEEAIGPAAPRVTASWDLSEDGRAITLQLADGPDSINTSFKLGQLGKNSIDDDLRFIRLWGDLLQQKSHRQQKQLMAS